MTSAPKATPVRVRERTLGADRLVLSSSETYQQESNSDDRGQLVCFCGIDGAGKSAQIRALASELRSTRRRIKPMKLISTSGDFYRTIRSSSETMDRQTYMELFAFERFRAARRRIPPELARGSLVLCDRYLFTDIAAAAGYGTNPSLAEQLLRIAPQPALTIVLTVSPEEAYRRVEKRGRGSRPAHSLDFLQRAATEYAEISERPGVVAIDATCGFSESSRRVRETVGDLLRIAF